MVSRLSSKAAPFYFPLTALFFPLCFRAIWVHLVHLCSKEQYQPECSCSCWQQLFSEGGICIEGLVWSQQSSCFYVPLIKRKRRRLMVKHRCTVDKRGLYWFLVAQMLTFVVIFVCLSLSFWVHNLLVSDVFFVEPFLRVGQKCLALCRRGGDPGRCPGQMSPWRQVGTNLAAFLRKNAGLLLGTAGLKFQFDALKLFSLVDRRLWRIRFLLVSQSITVFCIQRLTMLTRLTLFKVSKMMLKRDPKSKTMFIIFYFELSFFPSCHFSYPIIHLPPWRLWWSMLCRREQCHQSRRFTSREAFSTRFCEAPWGIRGSDLSVSRCALEFDGFQCSFVYSLCGFCHPSQVHTCWLWILCVV